MRPETDPFPMPPEVGCVRIRLRYTNHGRTPWKWHGVCVCGWNILSWDWGRTIGHVSDHLHRTL